MAQKDPIQTGTAPRSAASPAVVSIVLSPSSARKNATATLIRPARPASLVTVVLLLVRRAPRPDREPEEEQAGARRDDPLGHGLADEGADRHRQGLQHRDGDTEHGQHLQGRVAPGQGEGDQLGLVAQLGEEHDHERGAHVTPSLRSDLRMRSCLRPRCPPAALVIALSACGGSDDAGPTTTVGCKDASQGRVTLVAEDLRWDTDCLRAEPGPLTIEVDNQDEGVNHNVHLPDAPGLAGHGARAGSGHRGARRHPRRRRATSTSATSTRTWWAR